MKILIILLSVLIYGCQLEASENEFKIYHDIKWRGMPDTGLERIIDIARNDKQAFWLIGDDKKTAFPDEQKTRELALTIPVGQKIYFNIEHLPNRQNFHTQLQMAETQQKLSNIAHWVKSERPTIDIGFYTILPQRELTAGHWTPEWEARNDYFKPLASFIDTVYPSLYTFYNDHQGWVAYAEANIQEARKYNKKVIAFIWPQYHASSPTNANQLIDGAYWRLQIETLYSLADGVIIWTGGCCEWSEMTSETDPNNWWFQTLDFMADKGIK